MNYDVPIQKDQGQSEIPKKKKKESVRNKIHVTVIVIL